MSLSGTPVAASFLCDVSDRLGCRRYVTFGIKQKEAIACTATGKQTSKMARFREVRMIDNKSEFWVIDSVLSVTGDFIVHE
jgi:hypothetical protein